MVVFIMHCIISHPSIKPNFNLSSENIILFFLYSSAHWAASNIHCNMDHPCTLTMGNCVKGTLNTVNRGKIEKQNYRFNFPYLFFEKFYRNILSLLFEYLKFKKKSYNFVFYIFSGIKYPPLCKINIEICFFFIYILILNI